MITIRRAGIGDLDSVVAMMPTYYFEDHLEYDEFRARRTMTELIGDAALGGVYLIERSGAITGYLALCACFSLEFGGREAFVDELYVAAEHRGHGVGSEALRLAIAECRRLGLHALRLEVTPTNPRAQKLYERLGFRNLGRSLLAYPLD